MTNAEARFNKSTSTETRRALGRTAQDVHLDSHTAPELWLHSLLIGMFKECLLCSNIQLCAWGARRQFDDFSTENV